MCVSSSLAICILVACAFTCKFGVSVHRVHHNRHIVAILDTVLSCVLFLAGILLLVFTILFNENVMGVLLSLIGRFMIIHQVSCPTLLETR
jgi:hypothetical protein